MSTSLDRNKFVIGIDIDDTIAQYTNDLLRALSRHKNVPLESLKRPDSYSMFGHDWPGINSHQDFLDFHNMLVREENFFSKATPQPYAPEAIESLREQGAMIRIITTRFCSDDAQDKSLVMMETAKFLLNNKFVYDEFVISSNKDDILCDVYVDDSPSNVKKFLAAGREIIVPNTTGYTEDTAAEFNVPLMESWVQGEEMLSRRLHAHKASLAKVSA